MANYLQGSRGKWIIRLALVALAVFVVVEIVSFLALDRSNPPVQAEPNWFSPRARELMVTACYDCHSNETKWPWYTAIAPISWLTYRDVIEGRDELNFSEWGSGGGEEALEVSEVIIEGEMPPAVYTWMHPEAKLSDSEKAELIVLWSSTVGQSPLTGFDDSDDDDDD